MSGESQEIKVRITNPQGFHIRPMSAFAETAGRFKSAVTVHKDDLAVNGKSIWELMMLAAEQGTELTIRAQGADAADALAALVVVINTPVKDDPEPAQQ
jgi:phosphotransferase system HPr (HPr) family protein